MSTPGLPPQSPIVPWIGYDVDGNPYVLRWEEGRSAFVASGFRPSDPAMPWSIVIRASYANFIAAHDPLPS